VAVLLVALRPPAEVSAPLYDETIETMLGSIDIEIGQAIDSSLALEVK
jgi:hypothetical protein